MVLAVSVMMVKFGGDGSNGGGRCEADAARMVATVMVLTVMVAEID